MTSTRASEGRLTIVGATLLLCSACGAVDIGEQKDPIVAVQGPNYRITMQSTSPNSPDDSGALRIRVETRNGWKIATEAPARLHVNGAPDLEFDTDAESIDVSSDHLEFLQKFRARREGDALGSGVIKFGVCEGEDEVCALVDREFEFPLAIVFEAHG